MKRTDSTMMVVVVSHKLFRLFKCLHQVFTALVHYLFNQNDSISFSLYAMYALKSWDLSYPLIEIVVAFIDFDHYCLRIGQSEAIEMIRALRSCPIVVG